MLVSIIITCYNREKYIARAIRSAINQRFRKEDMEIIVVDDGSTDVSARIISDFGNDIEFIRLEKNRGLPIARNIGVRKARGRYVLMLDSDDYIHESLVYIEHLFMSMNIHWGAVSCDYLIVDDNEYHLNRISGASHPIACGVMFKKDALIDIGLYDEEMLLAEDKDLRLRFLQKYHIGNIELPLYRYRKHSDNITNNGDLYEKYNQKIKKKYSESKKNDIL
ncbi:MAG: glycosyltransferase family 2 protein [bacterium]